MPAQPVGGGGDKTETLDSSPNQTDRNCEATRGGGYEMSGSEESKGAIDVQMGEAEVDSEEEVVAETPWKSDDGA